MKKNSVVSVPPPDSLCRVGKPRNIANDSRRVWMRRGMLLLGFAGIGGSAFAEKNLPAWVVNAAAEVVPVVALKGSAASALGAPTFALGMFSTTNIALGEAVQVELKIPELPAGTKLFVTTLDGGTVNGKQGIELGVDKDGVMKFAFQADKNRGQYQVAVRTPFGEIGLPFWAGSSIHTNGSN